MHETIATIIECAPYLGSFLYAVSQMVAIFGKPEVAKKISIVSKSVDVLAGNWRKAKNHID